MGKSHHKWGGPPHAPGAWRPDGGLTAEQMAAWSARRRHFMRRVVGFVTCGALLLVLLLVAVAVLAFILAGQGTLGTGEGVLLLACLGVPLLLVMMSAGYFFLRVGSPLAELIAAADAVAAGDLSVRVRQGSGDMGRLARGFNRMTAELQRTAQARRNLTADVAHELRTPLHIIQGNLEGALDGVYEPTPEHLRATLDETRRLARLVGELQTLSLAEAGQLPLHRRAVVAADLLEDVAARFAGAAAEAGVVLKVTPDEASPALFVDPERLEGVLSNLTANALRHTSPGGHITLSAAAVPGGAVLAVADTGEGIAADDLPFVFDRFWRGDRARGRTAGAGLGLAIARQLVMAHGGTIEVSSAVGEGTTFSIFLPEERG
jgi:signal transduction histidine kinase